MTCGRSARSAREERDESFRYMPCRRRRLTLLAARARCAKDVSRRRPGLVGDGDTIVFGSRLCSEARYRLALGIAPPALGGQ